MHHDLDAGLAFLDTNSMDGVVCSLVIHHLADRPAFLAEVCRVLRPGGWLVLSTTHPTADWAYFGGSYFDQRWVTRPMGEETIEYQLMTISTLVNEVIAAGFTLDRLVEPQPSEQMHQLDPERYAQLRTDPVFLVLKAHTQARS